MPESALACVVTYAEPDPASREGYRTLGSYSLSVPPRRGETVMIYTAFGSKPVRYTVADVIHHMPPLGSAAHAAEQTVMEVTVVVDAVITEGDRGKVVAALCHAHRGEHGVIHPGSVHRTG